MARLRGLRASWHHRAPRRIVGKNMTILLIQQRSEDAPAEVPALPAELAGHALQCLQCTSLPGLLRCLRAARHSHPTWLLLESISASAAQWHRHAAALRGALDALPMPYIEIARCDADALDSHLQPHHAPVALVCGSGARQLSLAITTRRLLAQEA